MIDFEPFVASDSFTMENFNQKLGGVVNQINASSLQIAMGSYKGSGVYGVDNPNTLTFEFEPKLLIIMRQDLGNVYSSSTPPYGTVVLRNVEAIRIIDSSSASVFATLYFTWSGNNVSYQSDKSPNAQLNGSNYTYSYLAIG